MSNLTFDELTVGKNGSVELFLLFFDSQTISPNFAIFNTCKYVLRGGHAMWLSRPRKECGIQVLAGLAGSIYLNIGSLFITTGPGKLVRKIERKVSLWNSLK